MALYFKYSTNTYNACIKINIAQCKKMECRITLNILIECITVLILNTDSP
jgi:hypothetical protein